MTQKAIDISGQEQQPIRHTVDLEAEDCRCELAVYLILGDIHKACRASLKPYHKQIAQPEVTLNHHA